MSCESAQEELKCRESLALCLDLQNTVNWEGICAGINMFTGLLFSWCGSNSTWYVILKYETGSLHVRFYALNGGKGLAIKNLEWRAWILPAIHYETDLSQAKLTSHLFYSAHIKSCVPACSSGISNRATARSEMSVMPNGAHSTCSRHYSV